MVIRHTKKGGRCARVRPLATFGLPELLRKRSKVATLSLKTIRVPKCTRRNPHTLCGIIRTYRPVTMCHVGTGTDLVIFIFSIIAMLLAVSLLLLLPLHLFAGLRLSEVPSSGVEYSLQELIRHGLRQWVTRHDRGIDPTDDISRLGW